MSTSPIIREYTTFMEVYVYISDEMVGMDTFRKGVDLEKHYQIVEVNDRDFGRVKCFRRKTSVSSVGN